MLSIKADRITDPQTMREYMRKRLLPPIRTKRALISSMTPASVRLPMTTNRLPSSSKVLKSISRRAAVAEEKPLFRPMLWSSPTAKSPRQIYPLMSAGVFGTKDAVISSATVATRRKVGK